jgi:hypothetical protein
MGNNREASAGLDFELLDSRLKDHLMYTTKQQILGHVTSGIATHHRMLEKYLIKELSFTLGR